MKYMKFIASGSDCTVKNVRMIEYKHHPVQLSLPVLNGNEKLQKIAAAAVESYRQNAVDLFTDCPSRERAGWLCDSFFTGQMCIRDRLGGAPDTFMGAGIQTCRKLIDDGMIGEPVGAAAFMICRGHESWHPDPEFYYKHGGGPMMDMGPYYVTALINLLGGVSGVTGVTKTSFQQRIITSEPKCGTVVEVDVPTYITGILNFDSGAVGTLFTTFDAYYNEQARFEVYGSKGTLYVPDPNCFGGPVRLLRPEDGETKEMPLLFDYKDNSRALGLADMAQALQTGRPFRTSCQQTLHVLEVMTAFQRSSDRRTEVAIESRYERGAAMKNNPIHGILD